MKSGLFSEYASNEQNPDWEKHIERRVPLYKKKEDIRSEYERDYTRILHSLAYRRLKHKTQVFFNIDNDHICTRMEHVQHVESVSCTIAKFLGLNVDLTRAIAMGHDLGHTPFGHTGERILNRLNPKGFRHNEQSLRVVDVLENDGAGLNLTYEVRDGIVEHKKSGNPHTLEGKVVSLSDRIAYLNHDIDDAVRAGIFTEKDLPREAVEILGGTSRERINNMIFSILRHSGGKDDVGMEEEYRAATECLRKFLFDRVYDDLAAKKEEARAGEMISAMYCHYKSNVDALPGFYRSLLDRYDADTVVSDYISSMTDRYAVYSFEEIYVPKNFLLK